jgi:ferritin-like metal-binding protein YciE
LKEKIATKSLKKKQKKNCHRHWLRNILSFSRSIVESTVTAETAVVDATLLTAADNLERYCKASERCEMSSRFVLKVVFCVFSIV